MYDRLKRLRHLSRYVVLAFVWVAFFGTGCERQFVDQSQPSVEILSPDESIIFTDPNIEVRLKPASGVELTRVDAGNDSMTYDSVTDTWFANIIIGRGINRIVIRAFAEVDTPETDTLFLFRLPFEVNEANSLLRLGLAGHTVSPIPGGAVVAMGGVAAHSGPAQDDAFILSSVFNTDFEHLSARLITARTGHSATTISDRRIVVMGGGTTNEIQSVDQLVEQPELYAIDDQIFTPLHVEGDPIRRMNHTALYRETAEGSFIDLIGGVGDVQYTPDPLLGTRADIRSFLLRNDTLFARSPAIGPFIESMSGHTQVDLSNSAFGQPGLFLVAGEGAGPPSGPLNLFVDFGSPLGILVDPAPRNSIPRRDHAGVRIGFELVGLFGGTQLQDGNVLTTAELYDHESGRSFQFPQEEGQLLRGRYDHTATIVAGNLVMITGGFDSNGDIVDSIEFFSFQF